MNCPSCNASLTADLNTCPGCGFELALALSPAAPAARLPVPIPRETVQFAVQTQRAPVNLHVAMLTDRTGSSGYFNDGIRLMQRAFVEPLAAKVKKLTLFHQTHGDREENEHELLVSDGHSSVPQFVSEAERITWGGGGDPAETHLDAIEAFLDRRLLGTGQALQNRSAMIVFANADSKPTRTGASAFDLGRRIREDRILLYLVVDEGYPCWKQLQAATAAEVLPLTNTPSPALCAGVAEALGKSIMASVSAGLAAPLPIDLDLINRKTRPMVMKTRPMITA